MQRSVLLSVLGPVGAVLEVVLILYLIAASLLGCYSLPLIAKIRPRPRDTPMVHVIANCVVVLILSSALPLLARTLGKWMGLKRQLCKVMSTVNEEFLICFIFASRVENE